uniref:Dolichyl-diphosphooligosaccharide--protein glycosyltransferase subunit 4 n=1 Tax=Salix viminalis TaxID=40686 RepID=A0A6N2NL85_SALVM
MPLLFFLRVKQEAGMEWNGNSECYRMFDDQDLGFLANFLGIFIFVLVIAYHYVVADPKYEGN